MTTVPERLAKLGELYKERRAIYGPTDKTFGKLAKGLFPGKLVIETEDDWSRLALFMHILNKTSRYAATFSTGGHPDSSDDASVYWQMLAELDEEQKK